MRDFLLRDRAVIERRVKIEGKGFSSEYKKVGDDIKCYLRSAGEKDNLGRLLKVGKDFVAYFDIGVDVKEGDKLIIDEYELFVNGISRNKMLNSRVDNIKCICSISRE